MNFSIKFTTFSDNSEGVVDLDGEFDFNKASLDATNCGESINTYVICPGDVGRVDVDSAANVFTTVFEVPMKVKPDDNNMASQSDPPVALTIAH